MKKITIDFIVPKSMYTEDVAEILNFTLQGKGGYTLAADMTAQEIHLNNALFIDGNEIDMIMVEEKIDAQEMQ